MKSSDLSVLPVLIAALARSVSRHCLLSPVVGNAAGATIYGAIHLVSGNLTLTGAAGVAGGFWSLEHLAQGRVAPLIVSHVAWDAWIFLVRPTA